MNDTHNSAAPGCFRNLKMVYLGPRRSEGAATGRQEGTVYSSTTVGCRVSSRALRGTIYALLRLDSGSCVVTARKGRREEKVGWLSQGHTAQHIRCGHARINDVAVYDWAADRGIGQSKPASGFRNSNHRGYC
jgi:hypothetical protein